MPLIYVYSKFICLSYILNTDFNYDFILHTSNCFAVLFNVITGTVIIFYQTNSRRWLLELICIFNKSTCLPNLPSQKKVEINNSPHKNQNTMVVKNKCSYLLYCHNPNICRVSYKLEGRETILTTLILSYNVLIWS